MLTYVEELKIQKDLFFLKMSLSKEGNTYPNYITTIKESESFNSKEKNEENSLKNYCEIVMNGTISLKFSNETIGELICILPDIMKLKSKYNNISRTIISDIKKSSLEIFENFKSLKGKWKAMQYLK